MGNLPGTSQKNDMEQLFPELEPEQRVQAAENLSRYFKVMGKIYDHLGDEGKHKDTLLRIQYEKTKPERRVAKRSRRNDDTPTSTWDSNEFAS